MQTTSIPEDKVKQVEEDADEEEAIITQLCILGALQSYKNSKIKNWIELTPTHPPPSNRF